MNMHPHIDFIGIGAQKAATSWLSECLSEHPQVYIHPDKEIHFFSNDDFYAQGMDSYIQKFGAIPMGKKVGEFSTTYLSNKYAPERICASFPNIKIIVSLRNPIDRSLSHMEHLISRRVFNRDITVEEAVIMRPDVVLNSMYGVALERYLKFFSRSQIHVVLYDDIKQDPESVMKGIFVFLQVDDGFVPKVLHKQFNTAEVRSSSLYQALNKMYFFLKKHHAISSVQSVLRWFGLTSQRVVTVLTYFIPKSRYMHSTNRVYFQKVFQKDIVRLENILSIDLSRWKNSVI